MLPGRRKGKEIMEIMADSQQKTVPLLPWMRKPVNIEAFDDWPIGQVPRLDPRLVEALRKMDIQSLFPVQVAMWLETIGPGSFERDICVNSPTGSGKTLAYVLPIVQILSTRKIRLLRALVVLPTPYLAMQVKEVFAAIAPAVGLSVGVAVGQSSIADEASKLVEQPRLDMFSPFDPQDWPPEPQSSVDILIATPERLMDHIDTTKGFTLEHLCYLVVDESDRLLRGAYQSWLPTVIQLAYVKNLSGYKKDVIFPSMFNSLTTIRRTGVERGFKGKIYPRLVKMIMSATLTRDPSKLSQLDLHHPLLLTSGDRRYKQPEKLESYKLAMTSTNITPRGRGRGRGRGGGGRSLNRKRERESSFTKYEEEVDLSPEHEDHITESDTAEKAMENVNDNTNPSFPPTKIRHDFQRRGPAR